MNCANHADASAVAYCRTCGKALCANCTRPVRGVIYCEECLGAKMEGVPGAAAGFVSGTMPAAQGAPAVAAPTGSGPNPTVAGILAGFFPFGVGAVYTGQYAKGLAHLVIMTLLIGGASASDHGHGEALGVICGLGIAFFYIYQIVDAVRSAKAIQAAQPIPDPFGLAAAFSSGPRVETNKIPVGAVVLIMVGVFLLLNTAGLFDLSFHRFWPFLLIVLGGWMFASRWGLLGGAATCQCQQCRSQQLMGPAVLVTIGAIGLLDSYHDVGFFGYVGAILLVIGGVKLLQGTSSAEGHNPALAACGTQANAGVATPGVPPAPPTPPAPPAPPAAPTSEVNRG